MQLNLRLKDLSKALLAIFFTLMAGALNVNAQNPILLECMNINKAYLKSSYLSFDVKYKYAFEATPTTYQDSSSGSYKLNGYNYWSSIDSIEFMQNDSFLVSVFKEDDMMSVSLPAYRFNSQLPLGNWDSLFFQNSRFTYGLSVDGGARKITVNYSAGLPYKKFEMWYDSVTYRVQRVRYLVSEFASDPTFYDLGDPGEYGVVDIVFSNYQTGLFTNAVFNSAAYIRKVTGGYIPSADYKGYEVFLASAGL
jgi:hypothetical protein